MNNEEPTYISAAIDDWVNSRISLDRLAEIFRLNAFELRSNMADIKQGKANIEGVRQAIKACDVLWYKRG